MAPTKLPLGFAVQPFSVEDFKSCVCMFQPSAVDEEESGILQPHWKSRFDAQDRAGFSRRAAILGEGADAHGAGSRRGLHQHYSSRLSPAGGSTDRPFA